MTPAILPNSVFGFIQSSQLGFCKNLLFMGESIGNKVLYVKEMLMKEFYGETFER